MKNRRIAIVVGIVFGAGAAHAGSYSVTPMIATDYDFRGVSQTDPINQNGKPAFQLGGTYNFDGGLYAGAWGSNVDDSYATPDTSIDGDNVEIDLFGGYTWGDTSSSFAYDTGLYIYTYPGLNDANTIEAYVGVSRSFYSAKLWYTPDYQSSKKGGFYAELNANFPLGGIDSLKLLTHVGQSFGKAYNEPVDFSIGTGYSAGELHFAVRYVDRTKGIPSRIVASVSTTFPWAN